MNSATSGAVTTGARPQNRAYQMALFVLNNSADSEKNSQVRQIYNDPTKLEHEKEIEIASIYTLVQQSMEATGRTPTLTSSAVGTPTAGGAPPVKPTPTPTPTAASYPGGAPILDNILHPASLSQQSRPTGPTGSFVTPAAIGVLAPTAAGAPVTPHIVAAARP